MCSKPLIIIAIILSGMLWIVGAALNMPVAAGVLVVILFLLFLLSLNKL